MAPDAASSSRAQRVRPPAVAGMFYPAQAEALRDLVRPWLGEGTKRLPSDLADGKVRAVIAPHAGYIYSGPVAGTAFAAVARQRPWVRRVLHVGPSHRVAFEGLATPTDRIRAFATPLGEVGIDHAAVEAALQLPEVAAWDEPHAREHALETHLPFLQESLGPFGYLPLVFGQVSPRAIARLIASLADEGTLVVVSSDLSHYLELNEARRVDAATAQAIERGDEQAMGPHQACGRLAIQGLLQWTNARGWHGRTLDLRTSGDTAGPPDRVVGYGAFAFA